MWRGLYVRFRLPCPATRTRLFLQLPATRKRRRSPSIVRTTGIENNLTDEHGDEVKLKKGARAEVTVTEESKATDSTKGKTRATRRTTRPTEKHRTAGSRSSPHNPKQLTMGTAQIRCRRRAIDIQLTARKFYPAAFAKRASPISRVSARPTARESAGVFPLLASARSSRASVLFET